MPRRRSPLQRLMRHYDLGPRLADVISRLLAEGLTEAELERACALVEVEASCGFMAPSVDELERLARRIHARHRAA